MSFVYFSGLVYLVEDIKWVTKYMKAQELYYCKPLHHIRNGYPSFIGGWIWVRWKEPEGRCAIRIYMLILTLLHVSSNVELGP